MDVSTEPGLAARLKQETRALHTQAERSGVMADLLHGRLGLAAYRALLANLYAIYEALEAGLDAHRDAAAVQPLWREELRRLPSLERDLSALASAGGGEPVRVPATAAYVERLRALAQEAPALLSAHAYVRYLGDLHGGQVLGRLVRERLGLAGESGTAFYSFGDSERVERLRGAFRSGLAALPLTPAEADAFVAEACDAFRRHAALFDELQALDTGSQASAGLPR